MNKAISFLALSPLRIGFFREGSKHNEYFNLEAFPNRRARIEKLINLCAFPDYRFLHGVQGNYPPMTNIHVDADDACTYYNFD